MAFPSLHPAFQPWASALYDVAVRFGLSPRVTSTYRSVAEQRILFDRYRAGLSSLPAAAPGHSLHNYGLAFDMVVANPEAQRWLGAVWKSWGGRWGGDFNDPVHFDTGTPIT